MKYPPNMSMAEIAAHQIMKAHKEEWAKRIEVLKKEIINDQKALNEKVEYLEALKILMER